MNEVLISNKNEKAKKKNNSLHLSVTDETR